MSLINGVLRCDWRKECTNPVTHIGEKGYAYCKACVGNRRGTERYRRLLASERKTLAAGGRLESFERKPKPKAPEPPTRVELTYAQVADLRALATLCGVDASDIVPEPREGRTYGALAGFRVAPPDNVTTSRAFEARVADWLAPLGLVAEWVHLLDYRTGGTISTLDRVTRKASQ